MKTATRRAISVAIGLQLNELRNDVLKYTTEQSIEANSNGLALRRALIQLREELAPKALDKLIQYHLDVGIRNIDVICGGLQRAFQGLGSLGPSLAATFQPRSVGSAVSWSQEVQAWAHGFALNIPAHVRVAVEKRKPSDPSWWERQKKRTVWLAAVAITGSAAWVVVNWDKLTKFWAAFHEALKQVK